MSLEGRVQLRAPWMQILGNVCHVVGVGLFFLADRAQQCSSGGCTLFRHQSAHGAGGTQNQRSNSWPFIENPGFPGGSDSKESACNAEDLGLIPGLGRSPGERNGHTTPVFLPGEFHAQREPCLATVHVVTESDTTEQLTLSYFPENIYRKSRLLFSTFERM